MLAGAGYDVVAASAVPQQLPRFADQVALVVRHLGSLDAIVVDMFSGRRSWTPALVARLAVAGRVPAVIALHGGNLPTFVDRHPRRIDSTLRLASRVVAPSPYLRRAFEARGVAVREVPNLVDLPDLPDLPDLADLPDRSRGAEGRGRAAEPTDGPRILWMRTFDADYQPGLAVRSFAVLAERDRQARLTMAGADRGLLEETRALAHQLGVADRVEFPGYVGADRKRDLLGSASVFLNTTSVDNTPVSVLEAMAAGVPVVATDVGGMADLLQAGEAGMLVADGDPLALADALTELLADPARARQLASAGRTVAERHRPAAVVAAWDALLEGIGVRRADPPVDGIAPLGSQDLPAVVAIHSAAFPDSYLTKLGPRVVEDYYRWQLIGPHPDPVALGVWRHGHLVGFVVGGIRRKAVVGFAQRHAARLAWELAKRPQLLRGARGSAAGPVARQLLRVVLPNRPAPVGQPPTDRPPTDQPGSTADAPVPAGPRVPSSGILAIAVAPAEQGTGAAAELLDAAADLARARGFGRMHLTVSIDNGRARAFYTKHGWRAGDGEEMVLDLTPARADVGRSRPPD